MDRRDALKKIAVGGATVVGASAVISSPAFAYDSPSNVVDAIGTFSIANPARINFTFTANASATCPGSAINTGTGSTAAGITKRVVTATGTPLSFPTNVWISRGAFGAPDVPLPKSVTVNTIPPATPTLTGNYGVVKRNATSLNNVPRVAGDSFTLTVETTFLCKYSDLTERITVHTDTFIYTA